MQTLSEQNGKVPLGIAACYRMVSKLTSWVTLCFNPSRHGFRPLVDHEDVQQDVQRRRRIR